jgi:hypothetical protein
MVSQQNSQNVVSNKKELILEMLFFELADEFGSKILGGH